MSTEHRGNILNEITREEHDGLNNAKRVTLVGNVSITAVSQMTVTPQQAWPDPKTFIGLVTAVGNFSTSFAGNVTLDPGSKTGITGNVTLSDSKGFIGLTTVTGSALDIRSLNSTSTIFAVVNANANTGNVTLNPSPNFIGIVTVANPGSFTGNVTLDPGSRTGIVGNVTLSDSKGFIGLVTVNIGSSNSFNVSKWGNQNVSTEDASIDNNSSPATAPQVIPYNKIYNGSGWDNIRTADKSNATTGLGLLGAGILGFDGTNYRRVITGTDGRIQGNVTINHPIAIAGNVTLSDPKGFIGLVTAVGTFTTSFAGNVTLDPGSKTQIVGNVTISDSKGFIGLTTAVVGNIVPGTAATNLGKAEDAAHTSGDVGVMMLGVRNSSQVDLTSDELDYSPISTDSKGNIIISEFSVPHVVVDDIGVLTTIAGEVLHDQADSNGPIKIGGYASSTAPSAVSGNGDRVNAWFDLNGRQMVSFGAAGNVTLSDSKGFIGLVTAVGNFTTSFSGNVTLDPGSKTGIVGNVTLSDSKGFIGLVTVVQGSTTRSLVGNVTLDPGSKTGIVGNVTLSDSKGYIGLVTIVPTPQLASRVTQSNASIGTTPVQLLGSDTNTLDTMIYNISNTTIFIANTTGACNASLSIPVFLNDTFSYSKFSGAVFAAVNAGGGEVRFWRSLV